MIKCNKCDIYVDTTGKTCPLCGTILDKENNNSTYPKLKTCINKHILKKILLFIVFLFSFISVILNYITTPKINWSIFVIAGLFSMYIIFRKILDGKKHILKTMFSLNLILLSLSIAWDYLTSSYGWSIKFVLPCLCTIYGIFLIILRLISILEFKENSNYIYINVLLEFLPIILYIKENIGYLPFILITSTLGIINLLILIIFSWEKVINDLEKKWHI